ncbi:MAG: putative universal stress protein family [Frankiales bacterium]|nr:putative universal stress protein family [Frankiales bacterium]
MTETGESVIEPSAPTELMEDLGEVVARNDGPIEPSAQELTAQQQEGSRLTSPIVVGVSRRTGSPEAVRWAVAESRLRDTHVVAITAWSPPGAASATGGRPPAVGSLAGDDDFALEQERLAALVAQAVGGDLDALRVEFSLRYGAPAGVLLDAAEGAQLLVLDSPRAGLLGTAGKSPVVPEILAKSPCPVVVMPTPPNA